MAKGTVSGRVVIVTGGACGMGKAIACMFAQQGARIVLNDVAEQTLQAATDEISTQGGEVIPYLGDVTSEADVRKMVALAVREFGTVDILVNNAGVLFPTPVEEITTAEYDLVIDVSMKGCFLCSREVLAAMKKQGWGRIINMSSSAGRSVSTLGGCHYTAAKAGMLGLTRAIAREMAPFGITVNAVCPGLIDTDMVEKNVGPERLRQYINSFPIPRLGTPAEVGALFLFLASDEAAYITGAAIDINGGDLML